MRATKRCARRRHAHVSQVARARDMRASKLHAPETCMRPKRCARHRQAHVCRVARARDISASKEMHASKMVARIKGTREVKRCTRRGDAHIGEMHALG